MLLTPGHSLPPFTPADYDVRRYTGPMPGAGFAVTKDARRDTRHGGSLTRADKARANRRNRRHLRRDLRRSGEAALFAPKLWTGWDVVLTTLEGQTCAPS